jgi:DNA-binding GntR family transcriptional regulator
MARRGRRIPQHELAARIRERVVSGEFVPGARLTEEELASHYGVSRIPIREALRALEADGFVTVKANTGTFVAEISPEDGADLLEIRAALEPIAAGRAAGRCTSDPVDELDEIVDRGQAAIAAGQLVGLPALNNEFHLAMAHASGNASLERLIEQLQYKIAWVYAVELPRRAGDSWAEHRLLVSALARGDAEQATAMMRDHIRAAEAAYRHRAVAVPAQQ